MISTTNWRKSLRKEANSNQRRGYRASWKTGNQHRKENEEEQWDRGETTTTTITTTTTTFPPGVTLDFIIWSCNNNNNNNKLIGCTKLRLGKRIQLTFRASSYVRALTLQFIITNYSTRVAWLGLVLLCYFRHQILLLELMQFRLVYIILCINILTKRFSW